MSEQPQQPGPQQPGQPGPQQPGPPGYGYPNQPPPFPPPGYQQQGGYQQGYQQPPGYQQGYYPPPPGAVPPGTYTGDPHAPYGYDPYGRPYSDKSKIVAGVLQLFVGSLGVGRFYLGNVGMGLAQLFTCGGFGIWALIDGIMLLVNDNQTDAQGRILRS
ncbi:TM2 domain-containing protein [Streptomyces sp. NPDC004549]|uniref:TM2 domain-containing protein n=1 Tax=unclassified Streptomyces TaxID=2593676 RepID=UPI0018F5388D|nr:TM2 domain-containing protein [Streptomyces sp. DSM 110735]MBJ7907113.1 TM2 domain-containing protein [Streptomyces sp. DSM 110735]